MNNETKRERRVREKQREKEKWFLFLIKHSFGSAFNEPNEKHKYLWDISAAYVSLYGLCTIPNGWVCVCVCAQRVDWLGKPKCYATKSRLVHKAWQKDVVCLQNIVYIFKNRQHFYSRFFFFALHSIFLYLVCVREFSFVFFFFTVACAWIHQNGKLCLKHVSLFYDKSNQYILSFKSHCMVFLVYLSFGTVNRLHSFALALPPSFFSPALLLLCMWK